MTFPSSWYTRPVDTEREPLGVVDIGSNSVRLVVYEGAVRATFPLFNEKVLCGLGRSVASSGRLGTEAVERALAALARFRAIARLLGVKNMRAVATAAVRDARDGAEFIARAERACGTPIAVISGEREAELAALGVRMGLNVTDGVTGDLGGGSLELIDLDTADATQAVTLPLGGLRLLDLAGGDLDRARETAEHHLDRVTWLTSRPAQHSFYAVGGSWRAIGKLHMAQIDYPLRVMHGYAIPTAEALAFCGRVRKIRKRSDLPGLDTLTKARREVLPYGAVVLACLLRRLEPKNVVFSVFGIREGLLFSLLSRHERRKDPLLSFCEDYARLRSRSVIQGRELCTWTDAIFAGQGPDEHPHERQLRHAACLLSDIGWRAHPEHRAEQSLSVIAHAALSGVDHPGRAFLALTVYFRHLGADAARSSLAVGLESLLSKRESKRAHIVGAAIRAAHMLSLGQPGIIESTQLGYEPGKLVLTIPAAFAALNGERLRRRFGALAEELERASEIRIG
ncbi:MAG: Ppx/GppA family phosphatase [Hyphomicrobiaceae bacterium]